MKKAIIGVFAAIAAVLVGCTPTDELPTAEKIGSYSATVGYAVGFAADTAIAKDNTALRTSIIEVVTAIQTEYIPASNETFTVAWTKIATDHITKLVEEGKISKEIGDLATSAASTVIAGAEKIVTAKYPAATQVADLLKVASDKFTSSFLAVFKSGSSATLAAPVLDDDAKVIYTETYEKLKALK